ncbi:MAG: AI-2E family transporter [Muribaculaceae bacterium]|nr:AI-2E family transporter [Muribaculaceae bacterium]MDE6321705.1 AI-2E family transporter [Muribaculaceae bacterium]
MSSRKAITFDQVIRGIIAIIVVSLLVWLIDYLKHVLLPFGVACLVAYLLEPLVEFQQNKLGVKRRLIPVLLTLLEATVVLVGLGCILVPMAITEIDQLEVLIHASSGKSYTLLPPEVWDFIYNTFDIAALRHSLDPQQLMEMVSKGSSMLNATLDLVMHAIEWLLTFIYIIFIMLDYRNLMRGFSRMVPPRYRPKLYPIFDDIKINMARYFRSQAVIALCAAVFYCIGFSIVGLPLAIVMGILVGILYMIPYVQYVTLLPVAVLCYLDSLTGTITFWSELGQCVLVYAVSQCICDYFLTPKIMGKTLGLNPAIILLSLSVWGTLLGILGMIIALPITALLITYYKRIVLDSGDDEAIEAPASAEKR